MDNYRAEALSSLMNLYQGQPLPKAYPGFKPASKNLLLQTCRYYHQLESIALWLGPKKPKDDLVWCVLILGLCELHCLETPPHASINEAVKLIQKSRFKSACGFINALLRRSIREKALWQEALQTKECFIYAHPDWFIHRLKKDWPMHWQDILKANNAHPPMTLRVNTHQQSREAYVQGLHQSTMNCQFAKDGFHLIKAMPVDDLPGFHEGKISVQDEAAQLAVQFLQLQPHLRVLDACAAPGGKVAHMLEKEPSIDCTAIESQAHRVQKLKETLNRLNLSAKVILADASNPKDYWDGQWFDRILIDAPCSGTGVIRRHPDIKMRRNEDNILINTPIQRELLNQLWPLLKPGGLLLYATCSILPEENAEQIKYFIEQHTDAKTMPLPIDIGTQTAYGLQILPGQSNMDGFYYALIQKSAHASIV
jgi:16S rRNA (cytosine967-C5)-methyltransferase